MPDIDELLKGARDAIAAKRVYADPVEGDGVTLVPAAAVRGGGGGGGDNENNGGGGFGLAARPVGAYVIGPGERVEWKPAVDVQRLMLGWQVVAGLAVLAAWSLARRARGRSAGSPVFSSCAEEPAQPSSSAGTSASSSSWPPRSTRTRTAAPIFSTTIRRWMSPTSVTGEPSRSTIRSSGRSPASCRRRALDHLHDLDAGLPAEPAREPRRQRPRAARDAEVGAAEAALGHQRADDRARRRVHGHRQPEADACDGGVDADDAAAPVGQRAARVARGSAPRRSGSRCRRSARSRSAASGRAPRRRPR